MAAMKKILRNTSGVVVALFVTWFLSSVHQRWQLGRAAARGDLALIEHYYERGVDINAKDIVTGKTSLMLSVESGNGAAFERLIKLGASPDLTGRDGLSSTDLAASKGNAIWLKMALANGADVNRLNSAKGFNYGRPIYFAIKNGRLENVLTLLDNGANPDLPVDKSGATAVTRASAFAEWDIVVLLLRRGADVNSGPPGGSFIGSLRQRDYSNSLDKFATIKKLLGSEYDPQVVFDGSYFGRDESGRPILDPSIAAELMSEDCDSQ